jgi:thiosulfate reductase/polysulfide reductase chain A
MQAVSRRRFLQISAGAAGLAVTGAAATQPVPSSGPAARGADRVRKVPTFCDICFWKCGAIAYVKNDRLWKIESNPDDPLWAPTSTPSA